MDDFVNGRNHINYLKILELLHAIGELDSCSNLLLSIKLTIASLKPQYVDLFYKTSFSEGGRCGDRLESELKELAEHVHHRNEDMIVSILLPRKRVS